MIKKNTSGFTLTEVLISLAIAAIVSMGTVGVLYNFHVFEKKVLNKTELQAFTQGLQTYLNSTNGCKSALVGTTLSNLPTQITLNGYTGFAGVTSVAQGTLISPQLKVASLTLVEKNFTGSGEAVMRSVGALKRKTALVSLDVDNSVANYKSSELQKQFQVAVLVDGANVIQNCMITKDMEGACQLLGGTFEPITRSCTPNETCQFFGRYITSFCGTSNASYPPTMGTYPCIGAATAPGQNPNNEFTSALSCPALTTAFFMGETSQKNVFTVSCGKKCSFTVTHSYLERYYMCMRCY